MTWRDLARPIIARVISEVGTENRKALKAALKAAYPFGPRQYHPYKIWCSEIKQQLQGGRQLGQRKTVKPCAGQQELF